MLTNYFENHVLSVYLLNSTTMHVMLSVPTPSEAARFMGQILSNIISIDLDIPNPANAYEDPPLTPGDELPAF
jgi:hypothetical protein